MRHGSLFSGLGGFDLAASWVGWENSFHSDIDPFCLTVLKHHFPNATTYTDIRGTDFTPWRDRIDVLSGGFPCPPFSQAGKRKGTADDRYLWPEMYRAIQQIRPRWVVAENVLGIVNFPFEIQTSWINYFQLIFIVSLCQGVEEETVTAGEQPVSNKHPDGMR